MARQPAGRPTITGPDKDGLYHCWIPVGTYPGGKTKRKHIKRKTSTAVAEAVDELMARLKKGHDVTSKVATYGDWLDHWLENIIKRQVAFGKKSHNTYVDYEKICRVHLKPTLGGYRLAGRKHRLEPEHHELLYARLAGMGLAPSYIVRIHAVARRSQIEAYRRGRADRVPADLMDRPEFDAEPVRSLTHKDAHAVLTEALTDRDGLAARWALGILQGPRQGEVLGLHWRQLVLDPDGADDVPEMLPGKQLQRRKWQHGCTDPVACVRGRKKPLCKKQPCPPNYVHGCDDPGRCVQLAHHCPARRPHPERRCARHVRLEYCKPCSADCAGHASTCPQRRDGGLVEQGLKSKASKQSIALADAVVELLRRHRETQIKQFAAAGREWSADGYVFVGADLEPINPRRDWGNWRALLERAGVDAIRLHAARHTTGTFLAATGADLRMVQEVLRHASLKVTGGYVDVAMEAKRDAVNRVAAALIDGDLSMILGAKKVA